MPLRAVFILCSCIAVSVGCAPPASARFDVGGTVRYAECFGIAFPFVPVFHAYRERADSAGLFFQSRGGNFQSVDVVYFEIFSPGALELGTPIPLDDVVAPDSRATSTVLLQESCPDLADALTVNGTITFDEFSQEIDGVIAGTVEGALVNARDDSVVAETFSGEFDFTVQVGQPYEEFSK